MLNSFSYLFQRSLLFTKELFDELLAVNIENIFILLVFLEQFDWAYNVFFKHFLDFLNGFHHPREVFSYGEVWLFFFLKEWHQVVFEIADLVC